MTGSSSDTTINKRPHKRLVAWKKSMDLVEKIYGLTRNLPRDEEFGLKSQLRRAAVSVPSNIAEGLTRRFPREREQFLTIAQASLSELDTQLEIALRLKYIEEEAFAEVEYLLVEVQMLVSGLTRAVRA